MNSFIEELDIQDYGNIDLSIKEYCQENGIKKTQFISALNCGYPVGNRYYENKCQKVDLDVLAKILYVLDCDDIAKIVRFTKAKAK